MVGRNSRVVFGIFLEFVTNETKRRTKEFYSTCFPFTFFMNNRPSIVDNITVPYFQIYLTSLTSIVTQRTLYLLYIVTRFFILEWLITVTIPSCRNFCIVQYNWTLFSKKVKLPTVAFSSRRTLHHTNFSSTVDRYSRKKIHDCE